jgi:predicted enzyme related to lactoylglutathione lyase
VITGLAGVIVWTSADRFPSIRDFYRDVLGLEPRSERELFISFAWGAADHRAPRLTITVHSEVRGPAAEPARVMVNLAVDDLDGAYTRLCGLDVTFVRPPEPEQFGGRIATLQDPDGNLVQLLEQPRA